MTIERRGGWATPGEEEPERRGPEYLTIIGSLLVLFNLALAQPLLDLLGRNVEFFLVRAAPRVDIISLVLLLTLGLPLFFALVVILIHRGSPPAARALHTTSFWVLMGMFVLQLLIRLWSRAPSAFLVAAAALLAAGVTALFLRSEAFRSVVRIATPLPLAVAGLFLFASPASSLVFAEEVAAADVTLEDPAPVVLVTFDELPIASLMDRTRQIDERLFPNIARLANGSTWFRNTTTVSASTEKAVPAILDGRYPVAAERPFASDHPRNLFTLLGGEMRVEAQELISRLCPTSICSEQEALLDPRQRWSSMTSDVGIIALHKVLPPDLTRGLPPIDESWSNFASQEVVPDLKIVLGRGSIPGEFERFIDRIEPSTEPVFYFDHALLPHAPWRYLRTGQEYPQKAPLPGAIEVPGRTDKWAHDEWLMTQGYQRHLLQTALVDNLVGRLVRRLRETGLYDRSLIVVTADHGTSFILGEDRRSRTPQAVGGVAAVPLFVKEPFQEKGRVDDHPVQTIDILPTIADVLGVAPLWEGLDGRSAFAPGPPLAEGRLVMREGDLRFPASGRQKYDVLREKLRLFGVRRGGVLDPFRIGPSGTRALVGRPVRAVSVEAPSDQAAILERSEAYQSIRLDQDPFPALLKGRLETEDVPPTTIGIALNGRLAAFTRTYDGGSFYAMLPPRFFREGSNELEVYVVEDTAEGTVLHPAG